MTITLARVDDRVIHGQTTTRWSKDRPVQGIIVVSDTVAKDELRKKVLKAAAGHLKLGIYPVCDGPEKIKLAKESQKEFFLISDSPQNFAELTKMGVDFGPLNVGCMNTRPGSQVIGKTLAIDKNDYDAFETMENAGVDMYFQVIPSDDKKNWSDLKNKFQK